MYTFPGDVITTGTATTTNLYVNGAVRAGLSACSGTTDKLLWNASTGQFTCGTDAGPSGSELNWTNFNGSGIRETTASDQVLIAFTSTSTYSQARGRRRRDHRHRKHHQLLQHRHRISGCIGTSSPSQKLTVTGGNILQTAGGNPTLASSTLVGGQTYATFVSANYAYVADHTGGLKILDVSNPASSTVVGTYPGLSAAHSVVVSASTHTSATSRPASPSSTSPTQLRLLVGSLGTGIVGNPISLALSGRYLVVPDFNTATVNIVDVANPSAPAVVGTFSNGARRPPWRCRANTHTSATNRTGTFMSRISPTPAKP